MRAVTAIVCAWVLVVACATGKTPGTGDDGGDDTPNNPDAPGAPVCGDGKCASVEIGTCAMDCGMPPPMAMCGNTKCEPPTENSNNCVQDCPVSPACNHNQICEANENTSNCADDCPPPAMDPCPMFPPFPPSACKDCATGDAIACAILGRSMTQCMECVVQLCLGQAANGTCDPFETPLTCVDCFE